MSKYPNFGILDSLYEMTYGVRSFSKQEAKNKICKNDKDSRLFHKRIYNFQKGGYISSDKKGYFRFNQKGLNVINYAKLNKLQIKELERDGRWRIVIFDIPKKRSRCRHVLRLKLLEFHFHRLQKSVYVSPYVCEKEIEDLAKLLNIGNDLKLILAESLGLSESKMRQIFKFGTK